ncbi:MAG: PEP-CTERM sorting domain-containing protein [Thiobacillus sp.]
MNKKFIASAIAGLGLAVSGFAQATPIANQFFGGLNQLSDNNAEYLVNADGSLSDAGDSKLDMGDRLVGMFTIETIESLAGGTTNNLNATGRELTGVFDVTVISKSQDLLGNFNYLFAATAGSGIAVSVFDDGVQDFSRIDGGVGTRAARLAALMGTANGGLSFLDLSINQYWVATTTTDDISVLGALPPGQAVNSFLVSLNIVNNNSGLEFDKVNCGVQPAGLLAFHQTDICGSGSLLGVEGAVTPFDSFSNVDFTINVIPEPGMLALMGLGLLGMGASLRKRKAA